MSENSLVIFSRASQMLAEADTIQKAKELKDKAIVAGDWAKRFHMGKEAVQFAESYALDAERKMGQMLAVKPPAYKAGPGRGKKGATLDVVPFSNDTLTLAELGVSWHESEDAQMLAAISDETFEELKTGKTTRKKIKKARRLKKAKAKEAKALTILLDKKEWIVTDKQTVVHCSALITDPPYGILKESWEPKKLESFTREWLARWNNCKADIILSFWSQRHLFTGRTWFDESLPGYDFQQLLIWHYPNNKSPQSRMGFKQTWEPIFFYRRKDTKRKIVISGSTWGEGLNDFDCHVAAVPQSNFNDADMKQHPAQKPVGVMKWLINATTEPGELVCDPFTGSGTTGIAAIQLKRGFHGIETNAEFLQLSRERIATYGI